MVQTVLWLVSLQGNPSLLPWVLNQIGRLFQGEPSRYLKFLTAYSNRDEWFYRFVAAHQIGKVYRAHTTEVLNHLNNFSNDENDLVLEAAAHSWSTILAEDFDRAFRELEKLREDGSYSERRTAALAPVEYYRDGNPSSEEESKIESHWAAYESDPKQGLVNLVETQIIDKIVGLTN